MDKELVWLMAPLWSLLWILGGWKQKNWRRLGVPISLVLFGWLFGSVSYRLLLSALLLGLALRLPFTLVGDSLHAWWGNWVWVWVVGGLYGTPALVLRQEWIAVLVPLIVLGFLGTASNLPKLSRYAPWKMVEAFVGASVAYPYCLALS